MIGAQWMGKRQKGFTLVELLIVIVVIAVLAAITIVAYNGVQQRARDAKRRSDMAEIAKALQLYNVDHGDYIYTGSGCGSGGNGGGWYAFDYDSAGPLKSVSQCLVDSGALSTELKDPSGTVSCTATNTICRAYLKSTCALGTYIYASLESEPAGQNGPTNGTCGSSFDTGYGMNYVIKIN